MRETKHLWALSHICWSWAKNDSSLFFFLDVCNFSGLVFISFIGTSFSRSCCTILFSYEGSKINKTSSFTWQVYLLCEHELASSGLQSNWGIQFMAWISNSLAIVSVEKSTVGSLAGKLIADFHFSNVLLSTKEVKNIVNRKLG